MAGYPALSDQRRTLRSRAGTWGATGSLANPRQDFTATLLPTGRVLVAGGTNSSRDLNSAELYDPAAGTWSAAANMAVMRHTHTATLLPNGKVLVAGGKNAWSSFLKSAEIYDPGWGNIVRCSATGSMATARDYHTGTLLPNGKVLVAGGMITSCELYDPVAEVWSATANMTVMRRWHTATLLPNGKVLFAGGYNGTSLNSAELYDPTSGTWSVTGSMAMARYSHTATLLPNGKVLVAGGTGTSGPLYSAELYDPAAGTWSATRTCTITV